MACGLSSYLEGQDGFVDMMWAGPDKAKRPRVTDWSFQTGDTFGSVGISDSPSRTTNSQVDAKPASEAAKRIEVCVQSKVSTARSDDCIGFARAGRLTPDRLEKVCCRYSIEFGCCDCSAAAGVNGTEDVLATTYYDPSADTLRVIDDYVKAGRDGRSGAEGKCLGGLVGGGDSVTLRVIDDYVKPPVQTGARASAPGFMEGDAHVRLNVYHVGQHAPLRDMLYNLLPPSDLLVGAFHTGVQVLSLCSFGVDQHNHFALQVWGREWWYGFNERCGWGIASCRPRGHDRHHFFTTIDLGVTCNTPIQVRVVRACLCVSQRQGALARDHARTAFGRVAGVGSSGT